MQEKEKGSKRLLHRRREALKKCFVILLYVLRSAPPRSLSMRSPAKMCLCPSQQGFEKFEGGIQHMSGFGSEVQQHFLSSDVRLLGKEVTGRWEVGAGVAMCDGPL